MRDVPIASDLSLDVLKKRVRAGELACPQLNDANRQKFGLAKQVVFTAYASDRPGRQDSFQGEWLKHAPIVGEQK